MGDTEPAIPFGDGTERFEWHRIDSASDGDEDDRRGRLLALGLPFLVALLAILLVGVVPQSTVAHTTFTAEDVTLSTNSGRVTSLTIAPEGDIHYGGLEAEPASIDVDVSVRLSGESTWEPVDSQSIAGDGLEGAVNYTFAETNLLSATSLSNSDFAAADGETESTDIDVRVDVTLVGSGPDGGDVTAVSTDTMTVSVTNEPAGAGVGGRANSDGSGA